MGLEWILWLLCLGLHVVNWSENRKKIVALIRNELMMMRLSLVLLFGEETRKRFGHKVDEVLITGMVSSLIYTLWLQ